ncbi:hypothetical protein [Sulfitobacter mediterraneus]|uniref:Uncharacterized protein n=1 Tax=Sulfitobacter mediterraneus TaxID=83219 RepID=A0A2T6CD23_9RHOB|nr:hypothetical protein [Sulfitobacter mediterraneus]KIN79623.1 hypothetical protein Z950_157 [Sulfitobacter mediterraneus KCTC 32188]PTX73393.1 hypothetical protein C8N31_10794 [Sulfitobacter mediterraneus]
MTDKTAFAKFRTTAAQEIAGYDGGKPATPFTSTRWVASSLLQKAIRRGHLPAARQAGRFLLEGKREHLFRRLNGIAAEDIGLGDIQTMAITAACLTSAKVRRELGGDVIVTDYLIRRMVNARKSRAADDLLMVVERWPELSGDRSRFFTMPNCRLRQIVLGCPSLERRALALWLLVGTERCPSQYLPRRKGSPDMAFATLADLGVAPTLLTITRENFTKTATMLSPFVALLSLENGVAGTGVADDPIPVATVINGIPSWAFDMHTRPGRTALGRLLLRNAGMSAWAATSLPRTGRIQIAGELLFRLEGQCLHRRSAGPVSIGLQKRWEVDCSGLPLDSLIFGMAALRDAMYELDAIRGEVVAEGAS